ESLLLAGVDDVGDLERRRVRLVEHGHLDRVDLDFSRRQLRVLHRAAAEDGASNADDPLGADGLRLLVGLLRQLGVAREVRIEHDLGHALAVSKIDEDTASMVAVTRYPAEEHDLLALVARAQVSATVRAFQLVDEACHGSSPNWESGAAQGRPSVGPNEGQV